MNSPRHPSLKQIESFVRVVDLLSISDAAHSLNVSVSSVSKSLQLLESLLNVTLIKRTTRSLFLTDAGRNFYEKSKGLLDDLDDTINSTIHYNQRPSGELKLTCSMAFGYTHIFSLINEYVKKNSSVTFDVDLNDRCINLNDTHYDIALRISTVPPENYSMRKICNIDWVYCASTEYLHKKGTPESINCLSGHHIFSYPMMNVNIVENNEDVIFTKINSSLAILQCVLNHRGMAYLPLYLAGEHLKSGKLVALNLDDKVFYKTHHLYALYFPAKFTNPRVRTFIDALTERFHLPFI